MLPSCGQNLNGTLEVCQRLVPYLLSKMVKLNLELLMKKHFPRQV